MSLDLITRLIADLSRQAVVVERAKRCANVTRFDSDQPELPGSEDWAYENFVAAERRVRDDLSRLTRILLSHDPRAAATATLLLTSPKILEGENVVCLPIDQSRFGDNVLSQRLQSICRSDIGQSLAAKLTSWGIVDVKSLTSKAGMAKCRLAELTEAEVDELDRLLAGFGQRVTYVAQSS